MYDLVSATPTAFDKAIRRDGRLVIWMMKPFAKLRLPPAVLVPIGRPTILAGNHRSLFDVFCSAAACSHANMSCRVLVQARYFEQPLIGRWLRRIGCIPLDRDRKEEAFRVASEALKRGEMVGIMPEGRLVSTEERSSQVGQGRPGLSELALANDAVVRPIVFHNTDLVWPKGKLPKLRLRRPTVTLELGDVTELVAEDHQTNVDNTMRLMSDMLDELDAKC